MLALSFVLLIVPLFSYLQFSPYVTWSLASERFVFQASLGLAIGLASLATRMQTAKALCLSALVVIVSAGVVSLRVLQWQSNETLRRHDFSISSSHHSVVRELVIGHLLPTKNYSEAKSAATLIRNVSARKVMLQLIAVSELQWSLQGMPLGAENSRNDVLCDDALALDRDLVHLQLERVSVADLTYSNYAGHLRAYFVGRLGGVERLCGKHIMRSSQLAAQAEYACS